MGSDVARLIAFYLPQYHPIDLNDRIYGPGHTEWSHVRAARPLFAGHRQPVHPGELGYYDLRSPEVRSAQAHLAESHGVAAFCYWTYWSTGERILERPLDEVARSGEPTFPFCIAWANHHWHDVTGKVPGVIFEQRYGGAGDYASFFRAYESLFHDHRYFTVRGRPLIYIFRPFELPDIEVFADTWRRLAEESGLSGLYLVGQSRGIWDGSHTAAVAAALDAIVQVRIHPAYSMRPMRTRVVDRVRRGPVRFRYRDLLREPLPMVGWAEQSIPCVMTNWDSTPRWGRAGTVLLDAEPGTLETLVRQAVEAIAGQDPEERIVFLKSWNEWAEGNYLEPDGETGRARLEALAAALGGPAGGN